MKKLTVTAVVLVITAVMICFNSCKDDGVKLVLCYSENDEVIRTFDVAEGTEFSVEFIHSVNKSPVKDVFVIKEGKIFADRTIYATFGAGVQTEVEEGQTLGYDEEGNMIVSGFDMEFPRVNCIVGTVYDHVLEIGGESISLTELCGRNAHVYFELR
ncbi:MAG: DUF1850 domain-containing protein [Clostridia bacterium]|nr:DUF1850 domain-containing protein [Clostridia bacterium]